MCILAEKLVVTLQLAVKVSCDRSKGRRIGEVTYLIPMTFWQPVGGTIWLEDPRTLIFTYYFRIQGGSTDRGAIDHRRLGDILEVISGRLNPVYHETWVIPCSHSGFHHRLSWVSSYREHSVMFEPDGSSSRGGRVTRLVDVSQYWTEN
jgi:hypothetical protein